jgi:YVTN family beta-propeller protein
VRVAQRRLATRRFLATVLFTDIVGSTSRAAELGDRAWRDVLERHNAVVRRELKAFGGREMDTAGDGFFAVFETPERAVRCAESVVSAVVPLGLEVRAGVHTGECEVIGGKVGGMAVTIGARIAALAGAGQVLVSRSVRDLMTGSGRAFEGGEARELKGVADRWRVYRLVPDDAFGDEVTDRRRSLVPLYTARQRRRLVAMVAGVLVVVLAVTAGYVLTRPKAEVVVGENAVGVIGPGGTPRAGVVVGVGQRPTAVASGFGSVWVTNSADNSVSRIDPRSHVPVPIPVGLSPAGVAVGAGGVWVANSGDATVSRIDPATSRTTTIPVRPGPTGAVVAFGSVWVTNALDASVTRIDPATNTVVHVVPVGASPTGIAAGDGYLWVTNQGDGTVTRFSPTTYEVDSPAVKVGSGPVGIAIGDGAAWVANSLDGSLSRIDTSDLSVTSRTLAKGGGAYGVAAQDGKVWVSNEYAGTLMRVTARTFLLGATVRLRGAPLGLGFVGNDLWFTNAGGGSVRHRGGVLTLVSTGDLVGGADPRTADDLTLHYGGAFWQLAALTNDGLVGFRRAGGVQGEGIVPDLATSLPAPTDGGRAYTFHLRTGVRFSTGAPVLAGDIRRGIERNVVHPDTATPYYTTIVGAQACANAATKALAAHRQRPDCHLGKGIVADDRTGTITFHLTRPTPEFLDQLALPNASAVPQDTPVDLLPGRLLPATGPYLIRSYTPDNLVTLELVRNPYFRVWSPVAQPAGYPDRIDLEFVGSGDNEVTQVIDGRADLVLDEAPTADVDRLRARYGSQLHTNPGIGTQYMYLNTTTAPFNSPDARRAVAYALDRRALNSVLNGPAAPVTCQIVPPDFAGYQPYCPFTAGDRAAGRWSFPDLAMAKRLVRRSGTLGEKVALVDYYNSGRTELDNQVKAELHGIGYRASVLWVTKDFPPSLKSHDYDWNAGLTGWSTDYPAASDYLAPIGSCDPTVGFYNLSGYCNAGINRQIDAALAQQVTDPGAATDAWARIDRDIVDAAAVIPLGNDVREDFVSRRVGNLVVHPILGPLIDQMWVQ